MKRFSMPPRHRRPIAHKRWPIPRPVSIGIALSVGAAMAGISGSSLATAAEKAKAPPKIYQPNGRPPQAARPFEWIASPDPDLPGAFSFDAATNAVVSRNQLFTLLVIGSDARPGSEPIKGHSDSLHLLVWNPAWNKGILIGFPRDLYVTPPGSKSMRKLSEVMPSSGPAGVTATIAALTKIPNTRYAVTGFSGLVGMVNDLGGVNVLVDPAMNDANSGATFAKGWFAMNGQASLAFNRNRGLVNGDFGRSANQGKFLLWSLAKIREDVVDTPGLLRYVKVFQKHSKTNLDPKDLLKLAQVARHIDPNSMQNVVVKGKPARVKDQDIVEIDENDAEELFADVRRDAVVNGR